MVTWKQSRFQLRVGLLVGACVVTGCAGSKDSTPSSFDMSEYRQMMERQKGGQGSFDEPTSSVPEMTAEEHERAGDMDAKRLAKDLRSRLGDIPALFARHVPQARQMLRKLLDGHIVCEPIMEGGRAGYRFTATGTFDRLLTGFKVVNESGGGQGS